MGASMALAFASGRRRRRSKLRPPMADRLSPLESRTRYDPREVEPRVLEQWLAAGHFHPNADADPATNYSISIPPPNVTGELHMGHALNGTMQDILARIRRMQGRRTLWAL